MTWSTPSGSAGTTAPGAARTPSRSAHLPGPAPQVPLRAARRAAHRPRVPQSAGAGTPVYVPAKVVVVDDVWAMIGSDKLNRRSWSHDSDLSIGVLDSERDPRDPRDPAGLGDGARTFARDLRLRLWREHLDRDGSELADLVHPDAAFNRVQAASGAACRVARRRPVRTQAGRPRRAASQLLPRHRAAAVGHPAVPDRVRPGRAPPGGTASAAASSSCCARW